LRKGEHVGEKSLALAVCIDIVHPVVRFVSLAELSKEKDLMSMYIGEALVIEGSDLDNVSHIDLLIGDKNGPVGHAFANALARQSKGHTNLLAVVSPNIPCKPATVMITKVTLKTGDQIMQMFGPAQAAVARAVVDCVVEGIIPRSEADNLVVVCGVYIGTTANDKKKIYKNNYEAVKLAVKRAMANEPKIDEIIAKKETKHPFE
jgi:5,6,7,8-tetrahydromethanopterin hydro-lyase